MKHVLFLCKRNRLRSPTAEQIFADYPGIEVASAGLSPDAVEALTPELLEWADIVFVMEESHRRKLSRKFRKHLHGQRVICLDIPDEFGFMNPELIDMLRERVTPALPSGIE